MQEIVEFFVNMHSDFEVEYDGGAERAVDMILKNDKEKREISSFVRSFLGVSENIENLTNECVNKYRFTPDNVKGGVHDSNGTESVRKEVTKVNFTIKKVRGGEAKNVAAS